MGRGTSKARKLLANQRLSYYWKDRRPQVGELATSAWLYTSHKSHCHCGTIDVHNTAKEVTVRALSVTTCKSCSGAGAFYGHSGSDGVSFSCEVCGHNGYFVEVEVVSEKE